VPKFIAVSKVLAKLLQKQNGAIFWDTVYVSPCKISAKSDYPRLSYYDVTNLS